MLLRKNIRYEPYIEIGFSNINMRDRYSLDIQIGGSWKYQVRYYIGRNYKWHGKIIYINHDLNTIKRFYVYHINQGYISISSDNIWMYSRNGATIVSNKSISYR